jgi:hypothetical protein
MYWIFVPHLSKAGDKYGFVDERKVRISAGITLVLSLVSLCLVLLKAEFTIPLVLVSILVFDFVLKVFVGPQFSLFGFVVGLFLKKWEPIWVWAVQKRFAWSIGLFLSTFVLYCILILGRFIGTMAGEQEKAVSAVLAGVAANIAQNALIVLPMNPTIIVCLLCIVFMWLESVVGYCVGCHIYKWLVTKWWMKEHKGQNCVNWVCEIKK